MTLGERIAFHEAGHCAAALQYGIPILRVTISEERPHLDRGFYRAPAGIGIETMVTLCLAGPAAEHLFCGPISDDSDRIDVETARRYLQRRFKPARILIELGRHRAAAEALVKTPWARARIERIAAALLERESLTGEEIAALTDGLIADATPLRGRLVPARPEEYGRSYVTGAVKCAGLAGPMSASAQKRPICRATRNDEMGQEETNGSAAKYVLFDHLVGCGEQ